MSDIWIRYAAQHTFNKVERLFLVEYDLQSVEDTADIIEKIVENIDPCTCCYTEVKNHCDCDSLLDNGLFEIRFREIETGVKDSTGRGMYPNDLYAVDGYGLGKVIVDMYQGVSFEGVKDFGLVSLSHVIQLGLDYDHVGNIYENPELLTND